MSTIEPTQATALFNALKNRYERLSGEATFADVTREMSAISNTIAQLPAKIADVRRREYVFASYLEQKANVLREQWEDAQRSTQLAINRETGHLYNDLEQAQTAIQRGDNLARNPESLARVIPSLQTEIEDLERRIQAARSRIRDSYSLITENANQTSDQIKKIEWYLDQKEAASFQFLAGESVFIAAEAEWIASGKSSADPDGILYLTDQRLIFEQKETTGKTLGLFGGKKVQELEWALPMNQIGTVEAENKGLFGGKDIIHLNLLSGAPYARISLEVKGGAQAKYWAAQINRMIRGEVKNELAVEPDPDLVEALRNAPTACPVCGATLPQLVAGQMQITCAYCGTVVRI